ncbi:MAG: prolipoprotein diacylglyceryl transferase [Weeksellaceae bacterium]
MLPVLLDLGIIKIYTQGVFLLLAFFWSTYFLWKHSTLTSYKEEELFDAMFFSMFGGLLIGRIFFVALHFDRFGFDILKFFLINGYPGIHLIGALVGAAFTFYLYTTWHKIQFSKTIDYFIAPLLLALAIGKMGSFFSGSEVGAQTSFLLSLKYPNLDGARHLTPLYESILFFLGSFIAYRILLAIRRDEFDLGFNFSFFIWFTSLVLFAMDPLKGLQPTIGNISFDFIVSGIMLLTSSLYLVYYFRASIKDRVTSIFRRKTS